MGSLSSGSDIWRVITEKTSQQVFQALCRIVEEATSSFIASDGRPICRQLPNGRDLANRLGTLV